jgi:cation transport regulator ChaC
VPAPGQVAALAFEVEPDVYDTVLARLDHREKGGYRRIRLAASSPTLGTLDVGTYVAGPGDPNYAGPAPIDEIARCIAERTGPSGTNREYLLELARALAQWGVRDAHVSQLAARVCAL